VAKLTIAEEEMDESEYWLDVIMASRVMKPARVEPLFMEAGELLKILTSSRITAKYAAEKEISLRPSSRKLIENRKSKIENLNVSR